MYTIKREIEEALCRGCLSKDRRLTPLTNYDLYFVLLDSKQLIEDYKYINILLCWECTALLRRTQAFRRRLQDAQYTLTRAHEAQISTTLSTLKLNHKLDYDHCIEESIESKADIDQFVANEEIDIKEEFDADNFQANDYNENYKEPLLNKKIKRVEKNRKTRKEREKRDLQKIDTGLDLTNPDKYFSQLCLSEVEIEEILERERDDRDAVSRPHKCATCGFRFASKTDLYTHRKNYHRRRSTTGKCAHCSVPYKTHWELELHCWRSHPVNRCALCGCVVARERDRTRHLEQHRFRYRCLKCGVDFENKHLFAYHEKQLHSKYLCGHCGHTNATKKSLEKHIVRHHLPSKCPACPLTFVTWERLARHVRAAHARADEDAYCVECDASFPSRAKYRRHLSQAQRHRPRKKISVPCPECGKIFSRKNYMNNHMKLFHSNESRHHCQLCDKYFVNGFSLRSHNKYVHEKIPMPKTKICSVCGRGFGTNRVLENHMRTHTGERPFACEHCSAAFAQRVALKAHLAAIHKEK